MSNSAVDIAKSTRDHNDGYLTGCNLVKKINDMIAQMKEGKSSDFIYGLACAIEDDIDLRKE